MSSDPTFSATPDDRYDHGEKISGGRVKGLTTQEVAQIVTDLPGTQAGRTSVVAGVVVRIGGPRNGSKNGQFGQAYWALSGDMKYEQGVGLVIDVPDSVAEALRQQGRRQLERELRALIGVRDGGAGYSASA